MQDTALFQIAGIGLVAIACQWIAWRVKLPPILFLLLAGILLGPGTGLLDPDALFGHLLFPFVSLAVAVILFEGSLTLRFQEIRGVERVVRNLVSIGVLVTWAVATLAARWLVDLTWPIAILFGAVVVVTGPTVIAPILRTVRPCARVAGILRWEGIVIDPVGALLAVLVFEFLISAQVGDAWSHTALAFGKVLAVGLGLGALGGWVLGELLRRFWIPEYLHNLATLTAVCALFVVSNGLQHESGLLTVTVMGIWLANMPRVPVDDILDFKESLSVLLISALFVLLAARLDFAELAGLGWPALGVLLVIQLVARPLNVGVSALGSGLGWREQALLAWIAPRGIVAAAVSALFALRLEAAGFPGAQALVPLTFAVIIGTVVLQSATAGWLARRLEMAEPEPQGFLIVGADALARALAKALHKEGVGVVLADSSWHNAREARMAGLRIYHGNPVSEHADRHLDLVGIGRLLALSPDPQLNALAAQKYRREFGTDRIYTLLTPGDDRLAERHRVAESARGYVLFGREVNYRHLSHLLRNGANVSSTRLSEEFGFEDYLEKHPEAVPLFAFDPKGRVQVFVADGRMKPGAGWRVLFLLPSDAEGEKASD